MLSVRNQPFVSFIFCRKWNIPIETNFWLIRSVIEMYLFSWESKKNNYVCKEMKTPFGARFNKTFCIFCFIILSQLYSLSADKFENLNYFNSYEHLFVTYSSVAAFFTMTIFCSLFTSAFLCRWALVIVVAFVTFGSFVTWNERVNTVVFYKTLFHT